MLHRIPIEVRPGWERSSEALGQHSEKLGMKGIVRLEAHPSHRGRGNLDHYQGKGDLQYH